MAVKIPNSFDFRKEKLDSRETFIRDQLKLNIENWARFRYTIHVGNDASCLQSKVGPVDQDVRQTYIELGKSHYEVVTSLGCVKLSFDGIEGLASPEILEFKKYIKDFYFHAGCLLDNLARLIYIVNDPNSAKETRSIGWDGGRLVIPMRHWIDWGGLRSRSYPGYNRLKQSARLREIIKIRNSITHSWSPPGGLDTRTGVYYWPLAARKKRDLYWPYEEEGLMRARYRKWVPLIPMMRDDFVFLEGLQDQVFGKLVSDIQKFEDNHGIIIR
jgi:hypothetical protein